jgi:Fe-S oxidoreductase
MKKLIEYKEDIHKCSKCGLCQSICPVYEVTGNDCCVSRGKFIMLNGVIKGDLKLNKTINKYLDLCLKCNACKVFCPSDIDAKQIFLTAKAEYFNKAWSSRFIKILHSPSVFNLFMTLLKISVNIYRYLRLDKFTRLFYPILNKCRRGLGQKVILANEFVHLPTRHYEIVSAPYRNSLPKKNQKTFRNDSINIIYFKGCVNEYVNPRTKNAVENILQEMGVKILPAKFQCCGFPFLSNGNIEQFKKQAKFNLKQISDEFDYFLTDCASCQSAFKEYENYIEDEQLLKKIKKINQKSLNIVDFIVQNAESFEFTEKTTFTFHKPCHLDNMNFLNEFLNKAKNINYLEMKDYDKCCGFAGEFAVKNSEISTQISAKKAKNAINTKADFILTSCPSCVLGLMQGMIDNKKQISDDSILNFVEFLSFATKLTLKKEVIQNEENNLIAI